MRILQVIDKLDVGGAEKVFITLTTLLKKQGVNVDALVFDGSGELMSELDNKITVHNLERKSKYSIYTLGKLNRICAAYDIVHVHMRHCFTYTALAKKLFKGKYKIILHDHYGDIDINQNVPFKLRLLRPDAHIGVSNTLRNWAIEKWKLPADVTHVLKNTILPTSYDVKQHDVPDTCMISNFRKTKNIEFAIALYKRLNWPLTVYGRINDREYYEQILSLIGDTGNIKLVTTANGFNDMHPGHNFAIHTAASESGPLVLLEYMSAGIPFLAYNTGEVAKTIHEEHEDLFMDSFEEDEWIKRLQQIVTQKKLGSIFKNTFVQHFSTDKYISDCLKIYQSIHS